METSFTIKIKKRGQMGWMLCALLFLPFLFGVLNELLRLPWAIRYIMDVVWVVLVIAMLRFRNYFNSKTTSFLVWILLFVFCTALIYLVQYQSVLYYLWGLRNNFRFYAAFFAFATFLTARDAEDWLRMFDKLFWVNVAVSLFQYFVMDIDGDYLGGIFGTQVGANGYTNIFFVIILTRSFVLYLEKKEKASVCVSKGVAALAVAVLAELKFFFLELLLIIALAVLITDFSWRKFGFVIAGVAAVLIGAGALSALFPEFASWFSWDWILESALSDKGYTSDGDLNRLNAIPRINDLWLREWGEKIFGLGLGNCDTSGFSFLSTPFFEKYERMHYSWISYAHMYLECGWTGLVFYLGYFVLLFWRANKVRKESEGLINIYSRIAMILSILCVPISIYNSSLRTEAGYIVYFVLALPFIKDDGAQVSTIKRRLKLRSVR